jgi:hypothetical protein
LVCALQFDHRVALGEQCAEVPRIRVVGPLGGVVGVAAFTKATTPVRIAGGRSDHTATTAANSGSAGASGAGFGVE